MSVHGEQVADWINANLTTPQLRLVSGLLGVPTGDRASDVLVALAVYVATVAHAIQYDPHHPDLTPDKFVDDVRDGALTALAELSRL